MKKAAKKETAKKAKVSEEISTVFSIIINKKHVEVRSNKSEIDPEEIFEAILSLAKLVN